MESAPKKRKAESDDWDKGDRNKKARRKTQWDAGRNGGVDPRALQPGDTGIWATCAMKKEAKSVGDLRDLFQEYATKVYQPEQSNTAAGDDDSNEEEVDIEAEIKKEVAEIRKPTKPLFTSVKLDTQCLMFFRTRSPVEPVSFVEKICQDAAAGVQIQNCRYVKRLTPITACEKANAKGLEVVAKQVLAPHFHGPNQAGKNFAIRPSIRNNKDLTRDEVIKTVAAIVGPGHKVDLHGYDLLILVEIYKNIVGMSVVGADFEKLKRFNLDELRQIPKVDEEASANRIIVLKDE
ncbi:THUMP domain-containing protein [Ophiobolus disseminans]|uniref:THUMP domain-containing protein n=1 Tax=Ophiobolus disseminans TaxID=1469910 RepID=A0A6A7A381_9PLEO|nr:THUMP domain-containing protein [Ophiobolus disseminans]